MLRIITVLLGIFLLAQSAFAEQTRPEISQYIKGYKGAEGAVIWVMRIGPRDNHEVLVQISHIDNKFDGHIFLCKEEISRENERKYTTNIDGKPFELLNSGNGNGRFFMPNEPVTGEWMNYSEELSSSDVANPEHFLTAYLDQEAKKEK